MIRAEYNGLAKTAAKVYAERGGVSAKVIKAYGEVNGVSKLVYVLGNIVNKLVQCSATADDLSIGRQYIGTGTTANYAFFVGGGDADDNGVKNVDAYNKDGVMTAAAKFFYNQTKPTCVQLGDESAPVLLVACGPSTISAVTGNKYVYYYKDDLTKGGASNLETAVMTPSAFTLNGKAYIAGGRNGSSYYSTCYCYSKTNAVTVISSLGVSRAYGGGAATDDFGAIVGGRNSSSYSNDVDIYNTSNVHTSMSMAIARRYPMVARLGDGIVIAGGTTLDDSGATTSTTSIEYINADKVITTIGNLQVAASNGRCVGGKDIAVFCDGAYYDGSDSIRQNDVEYINTDFVVSSAEPTRDEHYLGGAVRLGNRVFIGGGSATGTIKVSSVEIYDIKQEVITT